MGVGVRGFLGSGALLFFLLSPLCAAPTLRLTTAAVVPLSIAVGSDGPAQVVEAFNIGDGALNLSASSSVSWISATVGASRTCSSRAGACLPIQISLQTTPLAKGIYTGVVTLSDSNAVDAPQSITVTVQMGGGVPDSLDLYVAPNGSSVDVKFSTNSQLQGQVSTQDGRSWLSLSADGNGSFSFVVPYRITVRHIAGMAEANYTGSITTSHSTFAPDNKVIPVGLHVTSQPIAAASPASLKFRVRQGGPKTVQSVTVSNQGVGNLSVSGNTPGTMSGGAWLKAESAGGTLFSVTVDPGSLAPGLYQGAIGFTTNAANGQVNVPVDLEIIPAGPASAFFGGGVNIATYDSTEPVSQGDIVALFGEQLSYADPVQGSELPLVTQLGGATLFVNDRPTPLYFMSYGQINFQIPYDTPAGNALVRVDRDGQRGNTISVQVTGSAARILPRWIGDYGIILVNPQQGEPPVVYAMPSATAAQYGLFGRPVHMGEYITIYLVGMGQTSPSVTSGAAAPGAHVGDSLAWVLPTPKVVFGNGPLRGGVPVAPDFAGLTPTLVGLYQINVKVPPGISIGDSVPVHLDLNGSSVSNQVSIAV